jgi:hypothetical protein
MVFEVSVFDQLVSGFGLLQFTQRRETLGVQQCFAREFGTLVSNSRGTVIEKVRNSEGNFNAMRATNMIH